MNPGCFGWIVGLSWTLAHLSAAAVTTRTCPFNIETGKFLDLESISPDQRLKAYQQYVLDIKKYVSKPCPVEAPEDAAPSPAPAAPAGGAGAGSAR